MNFVPYIFVPYYLTLTDDSLDLKFDKFHTILNHTSLIYHLFLIPRRGFSGRDLDGDTVNKPVGQNVVENDLVPCRYER